MQYLPTTHSNGIRIPKWKKANLMRHKLHHKSLQEKENALNPGKREANVA